MAVEWYFAHAEETRQGPYSPEQMKALALSGDIRRTDTVYKDGLEKGILASRVQHLFVAAPLAPAEASPEAPAPAPPPAPEPPPAKAERPPAAYAQRKRRAASGPGATITSQDGEYVRFRKKCITCGFEDSSRSMLRIMPGSMKASFFCRKCRKNREVCLHGYQD